VGGEFGFAWGAGGWHWCTQKGRRDFGGGGCNGRGDVLLCVGDDGKLGDGERVVALVVVEVDGGRDEGAAAVEFGGVGEDGGAEEAHGC